MSYVALYRKFRPRKFEDVVGQEHITKTIRNQILNNRVGHAYLFSGGRGSGKTSTAKILARAVNCENPQNGEPCNECEMCRQALEGSLIDITEMDAASNNGVDNIRDIREEVEFIPTKARYRVYIIDEVHMLSTGAFNALLKTLEEPPAHVIFILATTEPQKLPATILSRCQRFDFKRIAENDIVRRLKYICENSNVQIEENALKLISTLADGAMRDAISILDRCISENSENITENMVRELTGVPKFEYLIDMSESILKKNIETAIELTKKIVDEGKDISVFLWELIKIMRDMLMIKANCTLSNYTQDEMNKILSLVASTKKEDIIYAIDELSMLDSKMKWATDREIIFETGIIKICLKNFNEKVENEEIPIQNKTTNFKEIKKEAPRDNFNAAEDNLKNKVLTKLKENGKIIVYSKLMNTKIERGQDNLVHIIFDGQVDAFAKATLQKEETKMAIKEAVIAVIGEEVSVKYDNLK